MATVITSTIDRLQFAVTVDKTNVTLKIPGQAELSMKADDARAVGSALVKGAATIEKPEGKQTRRKKKDGPHTETV